MDLADYISKRTIEDGDCIVWTGQRCGKRKHPALSKERAEGGSFLVRRRLWELRRGPIPVGKVVRCTCSTPLCISLDHMELMTFREIALIEGAAGKMSGPTRSARIAAVKRSGAQAKVTQEQVREIRASDEPGKVLAVRYGISESTVSKYRRGYCRREFAGNPWQGLAA